MSEAGDFIDAALQYESSWQRAEEYGTLFGGSIGFYGSSVGAIRGTLRDAARRYPAMTHDEITALSSELWSVAVYERRLAAIILLQSNLLLLRASDLTRLEGFLRTAGLPPIADALARDVVGPLVGSLGDSEHTRARGVIVRWAASDHNVLRLAAQAVDLPS